MWEPDEVSEWVGVVWDLAIIAIAVLIFVAQIVWVQPDERLIGAGLALLLSRLTRWGDKWRTSGKEDEPPELTAPEPEPEPEPEDDPYDGPGGYYRQ